MASSGKSSKSIAGTFNPKGACVVIIRTEWNKDILDELEKGCHRILNKAGVKKVVVLEVPGAVEIPFAIKKYWDTTHKTSQKPHAFIALGTIIKGDTPHFEYVCNMVSDGVSQLNLLLPIPTIFGVLTVNTKKQALERIGGKHGHKGEEAADAALKMILLSKHIHNLSI